MKLSLIENLNLLKLSACNELIIVDILPEEVNLIFARRKELFTIITNGDIHDSLDIIQLTKLPKSSDLAGLTVELKELISKNNIKDPIIIVGINEFRQYQITIPADEDDTETWLLENSGRFLPEGCSKNEFSYIYDPLKKDDNYIYYNIVVIRNDYLKSLIEALSVKEAKLYAIIPFALSITGNSFISEKNVLYLHLSANRIAFSALNTRKSFLYDEIYAEFIENGSLNTQTLKNELNNIKEIVSSQFKDDLSNEELQKENRDKLKIIICTDENSIKIAENTVKSIFGNVAVNEGFTKFNPSIIGALLGINLVYNNADTALNFVADNLEGSARYYVENKLFLRTTLLAGFVLMFFLLTLFVSETYISGKLNKIDENETLVSSKSSQIEELQKENNYLKANLYFANSLKSNRARYSNLLFGLSGIVTSKSCFSQVAFKDIGKCEINCELSGVAVSQDEVARIIEKMESDRKYSNVLLVFSGYSENESDYEKGYDNKKKMIHFNISARYNAD